MPTLMEQGQSPLPHYGEATGVYEKVAVMLRYKTPRQAKRLRMLLPVYLTAFRTAYHSCPQGLARLQADVDASMNGSEAIGDLSGAIEEAELQGAEQDMATAHYHRAHTAKNEDALLLESLEEMGSLMILIATLRERKRAREAV